MFHKKNIVFILSITVLSVSLLTGCSKSEKNQNKADEEIEAVIEKTTKEKGSDEKITEEEILIGENITELAGEDMTSEPFTQQSSGEQNNTRLETEEVQSYPAESESKKQESQTVQPSENPESQIIQSSEKPELQIIQSSGNSEHQASVQTSSEPEKSESQTSRPKQTVQQPPQNSDTSEFSKEAAMECLNLQNKKRAEAGLAPLAWNEELYQCVNVRGPEIKEKFSHTRPDGSSCFTAVTVDYRTVGENIAYGYSSPQEVTESWYNSEGHKRNMLNSNFTSAAVVCYQGIYWVTMFIG